MKNLRNLFVLFGTEEQIKQVIDNLHFTNLIAVDNLTSSDEFEKIYNNNQSIICSYKNNNITYSPDNLLIILNLTENNNTNIKDSINTTNKTTIITQFTKIIKKYNCDIGEFIPNSSDNNNYL